MPIGKPPSFDRPRFNSSRPESPPKSEIEIYGKQQNQTLSLRNVARGIILIAILSAGIPKGMIGSISTEDLYWQDNVEYHSQSSPPALTSERITGEPKQVLAAFKTFDEKIIRTACSKLAETEGSWPKKETEEVLPKCFEKEYWAASRARDIDGSEAAYLKLTKTKNGAKVIPSLKYDIYDQRIRLLESQIKKENFEDALKLLGKLIEADSINHQVPTHYLELMKKWWPKLAGTGQYDEVERIFAAGLDPTRDGNWFAVRNEYRKYIQYRIQKALSYKDLEEAGKQFELAMKSVKSERDPPTEFRPYKRYLTERVQLLAKKEDLGAGEEYLAKLNDYFASRGHNTHELKELFQEYYGAKWRQLEADGNTLAAEDLMGRIQKDYHLDGSWRAQEHAEYQLIHLERFAGDKYLDSKTKLFKYVSAVRDFGKFENLIPVLARIASPGELEAQSDKINRKNPEGAIFFLRAALIQANEREKEGLEKKLDQTLIGSAYDPFKQYREPSLQMLQAADKIYGLILSRPSVQSNKELYGTATHRAQAVKLQLAKEHIRYFEYPEAKKVLTGTVEVFGESEEIKQLLAEIAGQEPFQAVERTKMESDLAKQVEKTQ